MDHWKSLSKGAVRAIFCCVGLLLLSSCASTDKDAPIEVDPHTADVIKSSKAPYSQALAETADRVKTGADDPERSKTFKGSGIMVKGQLPGGAVPPATVSPSAKGGGNVVLNFEAADLREVIRNILGDILGEAYLIDPTVNGQVTIRTTAGIPREALYATLETLLRMNNATMVREEGVYKILPAAIGVKGSVTPQLGSSQRPLPKGYSVQIVPLRYVGAKEMMKILEPFAKDAQALRADELRNLMIISGTELELRHLLETIEMFDIDWMAGMSIGIFTLQNTDVKSLSQDIQGALGENMASLAGALKFIPIERLNAVMVVSPQQSYLDQVKGWIEKFDEISAAGGDVPRFYVYPLRYARADKVAPLLQQAFTGRVTTPAPTAQPPALAPGLSGTVVGSSLGRPTTASSTTQARTTAQQQAGRTATAASGAMINRPGAMQPRTGTTTAIVAGGAAAGGGMAIAKDIQAVPDVDNNAILIVATPSEYALVEQALKKLDVPQRQVVMEVTLAEVKLSDTTSIGSRWWFSSGDIFGGLGAIAPLQPGAVENTFSLVLKPGATVAGILEAKGTKDDIKLVANPHIAALDNQEAMIDVTESIPYETTTIWGSGDQSSASWNYVEVGIRLKLKPHINEGGNVSMEASIEFSGLASGTDKDKLNGAAPPTTKRAIESQLMVPSGGTMVIGGLIRDDNTNSNVGVPFLSQIPVVGALFGSQSWTNQRTELVIFITPRVISDDEGRRQVIRDLRYRMDNLEGLLQKSKALPADLMRREDILGKPKDDEEVDVDLEAESSKGALFQTQPQVAPAQMPKTAPAAAAPAPAAQLQPASPPGQTPKAAPAATPSVPVATRPRAATLPAQPAAKPPAPAQSPQRTPVAPAPAGSESGTVISPQSLRGDEGASVVVVSPVEQPVSASPRVVVPVSGSVQNESQGRAVVIPQQNANSGGAGSVVRAQ